MFRRLLKQVARWLAPGSGQSLYASATNPGLELATEPNHPLAEIAAYDQGLYERARTQWQFGDWESLVAIPPESLQPHPERAKLALMVAAAQLQCSNMSEARQFIKLAQDWGCSKKLISQILVSGVHNSLGRAAVISDRQLLGLRHFEAAITVGTPGSEVRLMSQARANNQMGALQQKSRIQSFVGLRTRGDSRASKLLKPVLQSKRVKNAGFVAGLPLIVVAGMRHSGSTAVFNIIRLALEHAGIEFVSGYSEQPKTNIEIMKSDKLRLIKTHEFRDDLAYAGGLVITVRRDLRDSVASAVRREFPMLKNLDGPAEYAKYNRTLHDVWLPLSDYVFEYEAFMAQPFSVIESLLKFLGLEEVSAAQVQAEVQALPTDQYDVTLLSPTHITDPERKLSYKDTLQGSVIDTINNDHALWLAHYGYGSSV